MDLDYIECVAAALVIYAIFRTIICLGLRRDLRPLPPSKLSNGQGHPIDTSPLVHRLEGVRQDYVAEASAHQPSPGKALLVEERRAEIAKLAFFQKPPAPDPPEHEQGLVLLMV